MIRIIYTKEKDKLTSSVYNYIAQKIEIEITPKETGYKSTIFCSKMGKSIVFYMKSLQNTKRKIRKLLKNEFNVNLQNEVRNVLCG